MIQLKGQHVVLRTLEREHCHTLWSQVEVDPEMPSEPIMPGMSEEGADAWFEQIQEQQGKTLLHLGIFGPNGKLLGDIQLTNIDWRHRTASLGCGLALKEDRGRGYGSDAVATLLRFAFEHLDLVRISANTVEHNRAGQQSLLKLGFVEEGRARKAIYSGGQRWDRINYGLLRSDPK